MKKLEKEELLLVEGGANSILIGSIVGVIVTFVVGLLHGYSNPKSCN